MSAAPGRSQASSHRSAQREAAPADTPDALCEGCFRTLDEIAAWSTLDDDHKRAVWVRIAQRRKEAGP